MFGRKERSNPLKRQTDRELEDLRDDCIAMFINAGFTQKQIHERRGPTPATISKWLYKETFFPRLNTIQSFGAALGFGLTLMPLEHIQDRKATGNHTTRLNLTVNFAGKPRMPKRKTKVVRNSVKRKAKAA